tara:strand:- start:225 stop:467 length:243 start_codon:yes stop_codon:yes gene_type:complete
MSEFKKITVKELIKELKSFNPSAEVLIGAEGYEETKDSWTGCYCDITEIMPDDETLSPMEQSQILLFSHGVNNWSTIISK